MRKQWWDELSERNKVTQAENQNNQDAPIPNMNPITATEALRIYVKKLKSELSAAKKREAEQREEIAKKTALLAEMHNDAKKVKIKLEMLNRVIERYGLCNPDIQVARISFDDALHREWNEAMQRAKENSGMLGTTTVDEEYKDWEMRQFMEVMMTEKREKLARELIESKLQETIKQLNNRNNLGESK